MYVDNVTKLALGLEGNTDPTQAELEAAVAATGYTGYVAADFVPLPAPAKRTRAKKTKSVASD